MSEGTEGTEGGAAGTATTSTETTTTTETAPDLAAELEKWKALSKKNEDRAKANAKAATDLEDLRKQSMTEQEKAVADAKLSARSETLREVGSKLVDAELRAAAKGRVADVDALLEGLDRSRFLNDDGDPDTDRIEKWIDRIAPAEEETSSGLSFPDIGQGTRSAPAALGSDPLLESLKKMTGAR